MQHALSQPHHLETEEGNSAMREHPIEPPKLLLTVPEAARRLGIGRTLMYELISTGQVKSVHVGRLRRVRPADLKTYTAQLANEDRPINGTA